MSGLHGRVAFLTGASRGIGAAVARSLAEHGVRLGLASRSGADLGLDDVVAVKCDVRDRRQLDDAVAATVDQFGCLDIAVVNAGVGSYRPFNETPVEELEEMIDVNVKGTFWTTRAVLPYLELSTAADLVMVASAAGLRGLPGEAAYVASKFAQVGFARSLDHELRPRGIRCTNICPGAVATDFGMGRGLRYPGMPELQDMLTDEEVAEAVLFVLTRPRTHRIPEIALQHMSEASWG
jgi:3-oxoacyl-[acyl-carrier protein] reductase